MTKLFRGVKRLSRSRGHRTEVYAVAHDTAPDRQHWDFVAWSDAPPKRLRRLLRRPWRLAGGKGIGVQPVKERAATARYVVKDASDRKNPWTHLPARGGLNLTRTTAGFWDGQTKDGLWRECIRAWFGDGSNKDKQVYDTQPDVPSDSLTESLKIAKTTETIRDKAIRLVRDFAPHTPTEAITPSSLSRRVSVHRSWLDRLTPHVPGLTRTEDGKLWVRPHYDHLAS